MPHNRSDDLNRPYAVTAKAAGYRSTIRRLINKRQGSVVCLNDPKTRYLIEFASIHEETMRSFRRNAERISETLSDDANLDTVRLWANKIGAHHVFHLGGGVGAEKDSLFHDKAGLSHHQFRTYAVHT